MKSGVTHLGMLHIGSLWNVLAVNSPPAAFDTEGWQLPGQLWLASPLARGLTYGSVALPLGVRDGG